MASRPWLDSVIHCTAGIIGEAGSIIQTGADVLICGRVIGEKLCCAAKVDRGEAVGYHLVPV